jgi:hypothetical protein
MFGGVTIGLVLLGFDSTTELIAFSPPLAGSNGNTRCPEKPNMSMCGLSPKMWWSSHDRATSAFWVALPSGQYRQERILGWLASWKVRVDMSELIEYFSQGETMALTDVLIERDKQIKLESDQAARTAIARTMLQKQMSLADISEITGLSIEQVQQLQTQN